MVEWTPDAIANLTLDKLNALRSNASKLGRTDVVEFCDFEMRRRKPSKPRHRISVTESHHGQHVVGFHFVCPGERGVTKNPDGTFWSGTWVVADTHAEHAIKIGAYVALHVSKAEPSYLQGVARDWRKAKRENSYADGQMAQTEFGIDFLIEPTHEQLLWQGDGAGEKGYLWGDPAKPGEIE